MTFAIGIKRKIDRNSITKFGFPHPAHDTAPKPRQTGGLICRGGLFPQSSFPQFIPKSGPCQWAENHPPCQHPLVPRDPRTTNRPWGSLPIAVFGIGPSLHKRFRHSPITPKRAMFAVRQIQTHNIPDIGGGGGGGGGGVGGGRGGEGGVRDNCGRCCKERQPPATDSAPKVAAAVKSRFLSSGFVAKSRAGNRQNPCRRAKLQPAPQLHAAHPQATPSKYRSRLS